MTEKNNKKWSDEAVATLNSLTANESIVSAVTVEAVAAQLNVTARSVASKLRQLGREVASMAKEKVSAFTPEEGVALSALVEANAGRYTYKEIAEQFNGGKFTAKQIQGKLLALELTGSVKPTEKLEVARTYTPAEEAKFVELVNNKAFIEDIAEALGKTIASVRGKALSLSRGGQIAAIPTQRQSYAKTDVDPVEALGDKLVTMTVAEIAAAVDKTERGIRTLLTRRGIKVADYDGATKHEKAAAKTAAAA